jgi:hypothetical protein
MNLRLKKGEEARALTFMQDAKKRTDIAKDRGATLQKKVRFKETHSHARRSPLFVHQSQV